MLTSIIIFALPFALAMLLSHHRALGDYRDSALNPMLLVAAYIALVAGDYASISTTGRGMIAQSSITASSDLLFSLQLKHSAMVLAVLAGMALAFTAIKRSSAPTRKYPQGNIRLLSTMLYIAILFGWYISIRSLGVDIESLSDSNAVKSAAIGATSLFIFSMLLLPGLIYALMKQRIGVAIPLVIFSISVLLIGGSRTRILFVLIPFAFYLFRVQSVRMPRSYFLIGIVLIGFSSILALNFRLVVAKNQVPSFSQIAEVSNLFDLNDVVFAETSIGLARIGGMKTEQFPFQDMVGFALAAVPRSLAPIKPISGSSQFTAKYDPFNYAKYGRELTIGAINEITYDYPFAIALIVVFLFGVAFAAAFGWGASSHSIHGLAWTIGLYVMLYTFLKQDLAATGQIVSIFLFYTTVMRIVQKWFGRRTVRRSVEAGLFGIPKRNDHHQRHRKHSSHHLA